MNHRVDKKKSRAWIRCLRVALSIAETAMNRFDVCFVLGLIGLLGFCRCVQAEAPNPAALYQMQSGQKTQVDWSATALAPGSKTDIADLKEPGVITRFWATFGPSKQAGLDNRLCRLLVINIYWDGSRKPAVSAPLSDFFCQPLELQAIENEFFAASNRLCVFDCSIPMPFRKSARIEVVNDSDRKIDFFHLVHVDRKPVGEDALYLHAYWRRQSNVGKQDSIVVLPEVAGKGRYLGTHWAVHQDRPGKNWTWYDRRSLIFTDKIKDTDAPTLKINSIDDYLLSGWWSQEESHPPYAHRHAGRPYVHEVGDRLSIAMYRYHVKDAIWFNENISYRLTGLGFDVGPSDWSSTAFFYLDKLTNGLPEIQDADVRTAGFATESSEKTKSDAAAAPPQGANPRLVKARDPKLDKEFEYLVFDLGKGVELKLVKVKGKDQTFRIGSSKQEQEALAEKYFNGQIPGQLSMEDEQEVTLTDDFYLGQFEVTRGQFRRFVEETGYETIPERTDGGKGWDAKEQKFVGTDKRFSWRDMGLDLQTDDHPVVNIAIDDARRFCEWLQTIGDGRVKIGDVRLPGEAEWEFACRAGSRSRFFCGDDEEQLVAYANVADACAREKKLAQVTLRGEDGYPFSAPVGMFKPNPFGLYDMHGNVWEFCEGYYGKYSALPKTGNALQTVLQGEGRPVKRGGAWHLTGFDCRCANRRICASTGRYSTAGFRVLCIP